ncbi:hypothetical protein [Bacillus sp. 2205SS5-2]|uniref:hypothetical protein n=1 Tax=Bacillus sp. 2205SS5-2 TaxID=3109031 RepID=UPI003003BD6A
MDWMFDIFLPAIGGFVGGSVTIFWTEIKTKRRLPATVIGKFIWLGGISGFVAVNLLNPNGDFSVKAPLAILAGISPMSFLKGQAISDGEEEDHVFKEQYDVIDNYSNLFEEEIDVFDDFDFEDPTAIVESIKKKKVDHSKSQSNQLKREE